MDKCLFISKGALEYNLDFYAKNTKKEIIAVVKNNAYGHGVKEIVSIIDEKVKMYAVSNYNEAKELDGYTKKDILILDKLDDYSLLSEKMIVTIISKKHLKELIKLDYPIRVHLKIDVGLKRKGILPHEVEECINLINHSKLQLEGIYTHYSDYRLKNLDREFNLFKKSLDGIDTRGLLIHASSSISSLVLKESITNTIRLGVGMYGLKKLDKRMKDLKIVSELKCESKNIYPIKRFERFGYNNRYFGKKGYIIVTNVGYGDGIFYKEKIRGYLDGKYLKEIGIRNMDNMFFYSENYVMDNSEIELYGKHNRIDDLSKKTKIAVCRILALMNQNIEKRIID